MYNKKLNRTRRRQQKRKKKLKRRLLENKKELVSMMRNFSWGKKHIVPPIFWRSHLLDHKLKIEVAPFSKKLLLQLDLQNDFRPSSRFERSYASVC